MKPGPSLLLSLVLWLSPALAQELHIQWDQDLAFEGDRENYDRLIRGIIGEAYNQVSRGLGIQLSKPLEIRVLSRAKYESQFGSDAAWTRGAHYSGGAIQVNGGNRLDESFAALLQHEMTHAVVDAEGNGRLLPTWFSEGLAEMFKWRRLGMNALAPNQVSELQRARDGGNLIPLPAKGYLSPFGYLQCYASALFIEEKFGSGTLAKLVRLTFDLGYFDKARDKLLRLNQEQLESEFGTWVKELKGP